MYYETMEQVLSKVNKTIVEAPGVTPYLPLPAGAEAAAVDGARAMIEFVRRRPLLTRHHRRRSCSCSCSAASRSCPRPSRQSSSASASRCGSSTAIEAGRPDRRAPGAGISLPHSVRRAGRVDRQARAGRRHAAPAGALDRSAPAPGRRLRPLPDRRSAADVHPRRHRGAAHRAAAADPRLGSPQRARPSSRIRRAPLARAAGHHGQTSASR